METSVSGRMSKKKSGTGSNSKRLCNNVSVGSGWAVELELKAQAKVLLRKEGKNSISQSDSGFSLICIYFMTRPRDKVEICLEQKETQISKHFSPYAWPPDPNQSIYFQANMDWAAAAYSEKILLD